MSSTPLREPLTLCEVRAEMERLSARTLARGAFHPAEYWRMKELSQIEESLLGVSDAEADSLRRV